MQLLPDTLLQNPLGRYPLTPLVVKMIEFILSGISESIVLINKDGEIEFMDRHAEKFFNCASGGAKGLYITKLVPDSRLHLVAQTGVREIGRVLEVKGERKIVSRFPIKNKGEIIGAIGKIIFYKLEELENLNNEVAFLRLKMNQFQKGFKEFSSAQYHFDDLIGRNEQFVEVKQLAMKAALTDANILIIGESGTGKELFSHSIHNMSARRERPFIQVNCPAIPFDLAESELFGYEKGAFSGARSEGKPGKFELSHRGTIFLDEIGSLPLGIQAKLLRVLDGKEIEKLGGRNTVKIDFRLLAATNTTLSELMAEGRFRSDLFYRINSVLIKIPPLRERKEDIPLFIEHFLEKINVSFGSNITRVSDDALKLMINYNWPGNVRELMHVLEQSALNVKKGNMILRDNLPATLHVKDQRIDGNNFSLRSNVREAEIQAIKKAFDFTKGNKRRAAKLLEVQRSVLYKKLKKCQINSRPLE